MTQSQICTSCKKQFNSDYNGIIINYYENGLKYIEKHNSLPPSLIDKKQELFEKYGENDYRSSNYIKNKII